MIIISVIIITIMQTVRFVIAVVVIHWHSNLYLMRMGIIITRTWTFQLLFELCGIFYVLSIYSRLSFIKYLHVFL